jgi:hypothetical protein
MTTADWIERLQMLAARLPQCGVGPDLAGLALCDLWGVYRFLEAVAARGAHGATP